MVFRPLTRIREASWDAKTPRLYVQSWSVCLSKLQKDASVSLYIWLLFTLGIILLGDFVEGGMVNLASGMAECF